MQLLEGKTVAMTGRGGGLGRCYGLAMAKAGAAVAVSDISLAAAQATADAIVSAGGRAIAVQGDVTRLNKNSEKEEKEMALDWLPRDNVQKDHNYLGDEWLGTMDKPPSTVYEKRPLLDPDGKVIKGLYSAWIIFNNPAQFNSYTTDMLKGAITGFIRSSFDKSVVATVFTAVGDRAFCTGGNTKEYSEFYTKRPRDYSDFVLLFAKLAHAMLSCNNPVICRANGMRIAGGQELGMFTDVTIASDLGLFGRGRTQSRIGSDWGSDGCPAMDDEHGERHVELYLLRVVERL